MPRGQGKPAHQDWAPLAAEAKSILMCLWIFISWPLWTHIFHTRAGLHMTVQCWRNCNSKFKTYYKAIAIKTAWLWHKTGLSMESKRRTEYGHIELHLPLISDKDINYMHWIKDSHHQQMLLRKQGGHTKNEIRSLPITQLKRQLQKVQRLQSGTWNSETAVRPTR